MISRREPPDITIRWCTEDDIPSLHRIDKRASVLFARHGMPHVAAATLSLEAFSRFVSAHDCLVAVMPDDTPVGFAVFGEAAGTFWLMELGVDPDHMRWGIGSGLVHAVVERAGWAFHNAVCLTTFRDLPFNAPFYERLGFMAADPAKAPPDVRARLEAETPQGSSVSERVLMIKRL